MIKLIFKSENTSLATTGLKRTGRAICKIGETEVEVLRLELNKKLLRYDVYVTRDNYTHTYYPKTLRGLEEVMHIVSDFEHSKQHENMRQKSKTEEVRKND
ncbi:MAG: hypothetical protein DDT22_00245 [candidate division WS2 bacterium]|nr:hypothetical protein [Bacillota bacterium]MBT9174585.1 hypothetical protein [Candidatus Lithacetigena glycinireducens]